MWERYVCEEGSYTEREEMREGGGGQNQKAPYTRVKLSKNKHNASLKNPVRTFN